MLDRLNKLDQIIYIYFVGVLVSSTSTPPPLLFAEIDIIYNWHTSTRYFGVQNTRTLIDEKKIHATIDLDTFSNVVLQQTQHMSKPAMNEK